MISLNELIHDKKNNDCKENDKNLPIIKDFSNKIGLSIQQEMTASLILSKKNKKSEFVARVTKSVTTPEFLDELQEEIKHYNLDEMTEEQFVAKAKDALREKLLKKFDVK